MTLRGTLGPLGPIAHATALHLVGAAALAALGAALLATLGVLPWLTLEAGFGGASANAGMVAQIGLTALLWVLLGTIPGGGRMLALERSHRDFRMTMADVARAYHVAHAGDRGGAFRLSSEFDAVRERIEYLRDHPDLRLLEADVLTLAAQMSQQSHRLAEIYSDERLARARDFLRQRQEEAAAHKARIDEALAACREISRWSAQVELEEAVVASRLQGLDEQLQAVLPALGYRLAGSGLGVEGPDDEAQDGRAVTRPPNVVAMGARPAAE